MVRERPFLLTGLSVQGVEVGVAASEVNHAVCNRAVCNRCGSDSRFPCRFRVGRDGNRCSFFVRTAAEDLRLRECRLPDSCARAHGSYSERLAVAVSQSQWRSSAFPVTFPELLRTSVEEPVAECVESAERRFLSQTSCL